MIDLSAARDGRRPPAHAAIIRRLVEHSGMAVQVGGGIRGERDLRASLDLGVARVLVGTLAAAQPGLTGRLASETARVAVAADVRDGHRAGGRMADRTPAAHPPPSWRRWQRPACATSWSPRSSATAPATGPTPSCCGRCARWCPACCWRPAASALAADVAAVVAAGADGAVIGRALYDGSLTFPEASASVRSSPTDRPS